MRRQVRPYTHYGATSTTRARGRANTSTATGTTGTTTGARARTRTRTRTRSSASVGAVGTAADTAIASDTSRRGGGCGGSARGHGSRGMQ